VQMFVCVASRGIVHASQCLPLIRKATSQLALRHRVSHLSGPTQVIPLYRPPADGPFSFLLPGAMLLSRAEYRSPQTDAALIPVMLQLLPPLVR